MILGSLAGGCAKPYQSLQLPVTSLVTESNTVQKAAAGKCRLNGGPAMKEHFISYDHALRLQLVEVDGRQMLAIPTEPNRCPGAASPGGTTVWADYDPPSRCTDVFYVYPDQPTCKITITVNPA